MENILYVNGRPMPLIGFGTWQAQDEALENALEVALQSGYHHIDTAPVYENEKIIGKVLHKWLASGKINRSDLFIVSKLPPGGNRPESVEKWIKKSLDNLQLDYIDLYLVHTPFAFIEDENDLHPMDEDGNIKVEASTDHLKVWREMEKQVEFGRAKAIGLSNFNIAQIQRILSNSRIPVANLQIEHHIYCQQKELVEFCKKNNITITAYSPLGSREVAKAFGRADIIPNILENPIVLELTKIYKKTPAQIALKFILQKGIAAIPKSTNPARIKENTDLFGWSINNEDFEKLKQLDLGEEGRVCDFSFLKGIKNHPEFPF